MKQPVDPEQVTQPLDVLKEAAGIGGLTGRCISFLAPAGVQLKGFRSFMLATPSFHLQIACKEHFLRLACALVG